MTLFVVLMLPLVLGLGVWQLERADYKQSLMDQYFDQLGGLPLKVSADVLPGSFQRVRIEGRYEPLILLLDNQLQDARPGYWVYSPFTQTDAGVPRTWLVNRGWIAAPRLRTDRPVVPAPPAGVVQLVAMAWPDTGLLPLFGERAVERLDETTVLMQRFDVDALTELLRDSLPELVGHELRLEAGQPGVLKAAPQIIGFGVERHQGYAFQWFGLALALVLGYFFYGRMIARSAATALTIAAPAKETATGTSGET